MPQVHLRHRFLLGQPSWIGVRLIAFICPATLDISPMITRRCQPERNLPGHARNKGMSECTEFGSAMRKHQRECFRIAFLRNGLVCVFIVELPCHGIAFCRKTVQKVLIRQNHQYGHTLAGRKYLILVRIRINSCNSTSLSGLVRWSKTQSLSILLPYGIGESEKTRLTTEAQRKTIK